jgi:hypothetical protein
MKIILTASELMDRGLWLKVCEDRGISEWCVNEGRMESSHEFTFNEKEIEEYNLSQ